jgi:hypothetical protein
MIELLDWDGVQGFRQAGKKFHAVILPKNAQKACQIRFFYLRHIL